MKNPLLHTLRIVIGSAKPEGLNKRKYLGAFGISVATFDRSLNEARHLGAVIDYDGIERVYRLANADQCLKRAKTWFKLESERYLTKT